MDTDVFDVVVVGAGIMGSSTAYYLVNQGRKVLLLEQFRLPHTRGSSHGQSRGFRKAYPQKFYADMTDEALEAWNRLERESGTSLYRRTGLLVVGKKGSQCLEETDVTLKQTNCSHERLSHAQMTKRYPQFSYPDNYEGVLDHTAGILWASAAVLAYQTVFRCRGGVLNDGDKVLRIIPADISEVVTSRARYKTRNVIITAGPWTNKILKDLGLSLPLKTLRTYLPYWRVAPNGGMSIEDKSAPCMSEKIGPDADENYVYHSPSAEYPGHVKVKCTCTILYCNYIYFLLDGCKLYGWKKRDGLVLYYLSDLCFTPYSGVFHLYNGCQHYGRRKRSPGKDKTIRRLLAGLPMYDRRGSRHELDLNAERLH